MKKSKSRTIKEFNNCVVNLRIRIGIVYFSSSTLYNTCEFNETDGETLEKHTKT
jgi:hypothetical protein